MALRKHELQLDRTSEVPLGTQLAWKLRGAIIGARLRPGERIPGVREVAASAGVNVNTVRAVYARLAQQGLIVSERGRGSFVSTQAVEHAALRELAERAARDARSRGVDPRELASLLFAAPEQQDEPEARRSLRAQIAALEQELAELSVEPEPGEWPAAVERAGEVRGARLLSAAELEDVRDELARRLAERRAAAEDRPAPPRRSGRTTTAAEPAEAGGAWPELLGGELGWHPG